MNVVLGDEDVQSIAKGCETEAPDQLW